MRRLAVLSMHTSPLAQPGTGDGGGMNVYVRELASSLARSGVACDVYTRRWSQDLPGVLDVEPGMRVHHVDAGPRAEIGKDDLPAHVGEFADGVMAIMDAAPETTDALHANYWLSGMAGHVIKHARELPLVSTFHTLDRMKAEPEPDLFAQLTRAQGESEVMGCSDTVLASCSVEADQIRDLYGTHTERISVVAPGVDHAFFGPGDRSQARRALGLPESGEMILFVGRLQPLKGATVAIEALDLLRGASRFLVVVGGPSGPQGADEMARCHSLVDELGLADSVYFVEPQRHELLSIFYRAADVCVVPSRSESFGLVALEAAACGIPVVASAVGGLITLVQDGVTGYLVDGRDPGLFAARIEDVLSDPDRRAEMSRRASSIALRYTWKETARALRGIYERLTARELVECS